MKKIKILSILISGLFLLNCSSESEEIFEQTKLLKEYTSPNAEISYRNEFFEYDNDFLIGYQYNGRTSKYKYNDSGKLISKNNNLDNIEYYYDNQNRLIKSVNKTTNSYFELIYENNKISITSFQSNGTVDFIYEHFIDTKGRIIKIVNPYNQTTYRIKEYTYNDKGNITKEILKDNSIYDNRENNYEYYETINPFFISYKKVNESIYHLVNLDGINIYTTNGTTPNIIVRKNYSYITDKSNYPTKLTINNESIWEYKYE